MIQHGLGYLVEILVTAWEFTGEKGKASLMNIPGVREDANIWYESTREEIWLFGGTGYSDAFSGV